MKIFNKEYLEERLYSGDYEDDYELYKSRWSSNRALIFEYEGKYYKAKYSKGLSESQMEAPFEYSDDEIECEEVNKVPFLSYKWIETDESSKELDVLRKTLEAINNICSEYYNKVECYDDECPICEILGECPVETIPKTWDVYHDKENE